MLIIASRKSGLAGKRGSLTVEAAIVLPIFIFAVISVMSFFKMLYTYEKMQYALLGAAEELSIYSYLLEATGITELNTKFKDKVAEGQQMVEDTENTLEDSQDALNRVDIAEMMDSIAQMERIGKDLQEDQGQLLEAMLAMFSENLFEKSKTALVIPVYKMLLKEQLKWRNTPDGEMIFMNQFNIRNGYDGIDFSESEFLKDTQTIKIVAKYTLAPPMPFGPKGIKVRQFAVVRSWTSGESCLNEREAASENMSTSVWDMPPFQRGRRIAELEGGHLPDAAGAANAFTSNGTVINIASIDLEAKTYQKTAALKSKIIQEVNRIVAFNGFIDTKRSICILEKDIRYREVLLIFPEIDISEDIKAVIDHCEQYAVKQGVTMKCKKAYGKASTIEEETNEQ